MATYTLILIGAVVTVVSARSAPLTVTDHPVLKVEHIFRNGNERSYDQNPFRKQVTHHDSNKDRNNTDDLQLVMNLNRRNQSRNDSQSHSLNENLSDNRNSKEVAADVLNSRDQEIDVQNYQYVNKTSHIGNNTVAKSRKTVDKNNKVAKRVNDDKKSEVTKTVHDNEVTPRTEAKKQKEDDTDRWIWESGDDVKVTTAATPPITIADRASFIGDTCPTGTVKINGMCINTD